MNEDKILKLITIKLEEYGMPHYKDQCPAMDILQIIKDCGFSRDSGERLDELIKEW